MSRLSDRDKTGVCLSWLRFENQSLQSWFEEIVRSRTIGELPHAEKSDAFKRKLEKLGVSLGAHQVLEVLFRQALMKYSPNIKFQIDWIEPKILTAKTHQDKLDACFDYLKKWTTHAKKALPESTFQYGSDQIIVGDFFLRRLFDETVFSIADIYRKALKELLELGKFEQGISKEVGVSGGAFIKAEFDLLDKQAESLGDRFSKNYWKKYPGITDKKSFFLKGNKDEFFQIYLGIALGVFGPYMYHLSKDKIREYEPEGVNTDFSSFISNKMNHHFSWIADYASLTPDTVRQRLKRKGSYIDLEAFPKSQTLMSDDFAKFLFSYSKRKNKAA